ncbi:MAG TPA: FUSC family protein, partial [Rhodopila sp.]
MQWPGLRDWMFASKTFVAAVLALYIALSLGLDRPYWAMASAYIASQPLSGATRSKAVYRLCGTVAGATAAVLLVPAFAEAPPLLSLVLALWVAGCLYLSLLDRTPRSYACMLAGYSAAIIGFPSVVAPEAIFDTALTRVEEIAIGVSLATLVAGIVFPRPVGPALITRIDAWFENARRWSIEALSDRDTAAMEARRLAADGVEINLLASHLSYDATAWETVHFGQLRARMIMLIPILASIADRMAALRARMPQPAAALAADLVEWLESGVSGDAQSLSARIDEMAASLSRKSDWDALLLTSLLIRMRELTGILTDCATLRRQMASPVRPAEAALHFAPEAVAAPAWHRDHGMALLSAAACAVAILLSCTIWIATAWNEGYIAAEMVAVACSFFAAQDDPVPAIIQFLGWSLVAVVMDGILLFGVLPAASDFITVVLALAPLFLIGGVLIAMPATANGGRAFTANAATLLALQSAYTADFPAFVNSGLGFLLGLALAATVTRLIRSVGAGFGVYRLLRIIWLDLAIAAERRGNRDRARYAGLMLDRLGLIAPRLAETEPDAAPTDALTDIRIGFNIIDLRRARHVVALPVRERIDAMLDALANAYRSR